MIADGSKKRLPVPRLRLLAIAGRLGIGGIRRLSPALLNFLLAKRPQMRMAWGHNEVHLRRDGLVVVPRETAPIREESVVGPGARRRNAPAMPSQPTQDGKGYMFQTPAEGIETDGRPLAMDRDSLDAEVKERMGERAGSDLEQLDDALRDAEKLNTELLRIRDILQALDDVEDHELIGELDDEMYKLYKAVDYKIRRHHSSEAKVELGKLFKM